MRAASDAALPMLSMQSLEHADPVTGCSVHHAHAASLSLDNAAMVLHYLHVIVS